MWNPYAFPFVNGTGQNDFIGTQVYLSHCCINITMSFTGTDMNVCGIHWRVFRTTKDLA